MKVALVLNSEAGTLRTLDAHAVADELADIFREAGRDVTIKVTAGRGVEGAIRDGARKAEAIVVGGGDGTIASAAAIAAETGVALGVLPLGTMNFFAKALAIPADMKEAAKALATGEVRSVDIARVNDRSFIHTLALGLHPTMVAEREKLSYGSRIGKMLGSARAFVRVLRHPRRFEVAIEGGGESLHRRTAGVVVSNNPLGKGHMPYPDRLDTGLLGVYVTTARGWIQLTRVTAAAAIGAAEDHPLVAYLTAPRITITLGRHAYVPTTLDGELARLGGPLKVEIVAGGLKVLAPKAKPADTAKD